MVDDIRLQNEPEKNKKEQEDQFPGLRPDPVRSPEAQSIMENDRGSIDNISVKSSKQKEEKAKNSKSWKEQFFSRGLEVWPHTKKQKTIGLVIIVLLLIFGSITVFALNKILDKPFEISNSSIVQDESGTEPSRLTGVEITKKLNKHHVTSVMIENSPDARPQSGLYNAGVVFEAISEGGITRFNALFLEAQPNYIGPIRSVRPYYVDLFLPFDPSFAHVGGSAQGLAKVRELKVKDLDQFSNSGAYQRVSSRVAPHNVYSSIEALDKVSNERGFNESTFTSWLRNKKEKPAKKVTAGNINLSISGPNYDVSYKYDKKSNSYARTMAGRPHTDERAKKQIKPKVVIAAVMKYSTAGIYSVYKTTGSGEVFIFQNGEVTKGTWTKSGSKSQFQFKDKAGNIIKLNPGKTWVTLMGSSGDVKFTP